MTTPTPDPLALAEEAIRELEQLAAFAIPHGYVMQFDAISALATALRAAHEENARLREALENMHSYYCRQSCGPEGHTERCDTTTVALAGGKGEG